MKTPERRQRRRSGVFDVNFEHASHLAVVFLFNFEHVIVDWEFSVRTQWCIQNFVKNNGFKTDTLFKPEALQIIEHSILILHDN